MPKKDTTKTDKRVNNGKTPTWGVVKKFRGIRLTDTAWLFDQAETNSLAS